MKIWFVLGAPENLFGGGEVFAVRLARWLKIRGHDVEVVARPDSLTLEAARKAYLKVRDLRLRNDIDFPSRWKLKRWFKAAQPDAVIGAWGRDIKLSAKAAKSVGARLFWLQGTALSNASKSHRKLDSQYLSGHFVPSEFTKAQLAEQGQIDPARITVVYPGIDPEPFVPDEHAADRSDEFRRAYDISADATVVLCLSRFVEIKGHTFLLDAWAEICRTHDNALLVLAGAGPLDAALKARVAELGIADRVRFTGHLPDTRPALWNADILTLPSLEEPLGIVTLEAMAAGAAVVASRVGGVPEVVEHEVSGMLVHPGHAPALRDAIARLVADKEFRLRMVRAGHERVVRFSADQCFPVFEAALAANNIEAVCA